LPSARSRPARFAVLRNGHRNGVNADLAAGLILAIDGALRDAPARGTTMTTDSHVDTLLDLRLAVQELVVLVPLDADINALHRGRRAPASVNEPDVPARSERATEQAYPGS
jgi:hypothetical protein